MKALVLRLVTFFVLSLFAVGMSAQDDVLNRDFNTGGGGGSSCSACQAGMTGNGPIVMSCTSPEPGDMGLEFCRIESYPEGTYCILDGSECCVD